MLVDPSSRCAIVETYVVREWSLRLSSRLVATRFWAGRETALVGKWNRSWWQLQANPGLRNGRLGGVQGGLSSPQIRKPLEVPSTTYELTPGCLRHAFKLEGGVPINLTHH